MNETQKRKQKKLVGQLINYFGTQAKMAQAIGIHQGGISSYLNGRHGMSQTVAKTIERVTGGKFKAVDLCPRIGRHNENAQIEELIRLREANRSDS